MTPSLSRTALLLLMLSSAGCRAADNDPGSHPDGATTTPVVRQIDHILIEAVEANALFALLSDTLQLPVAWPMVDHGGFASGGIALGNVNLEILKSTNTLAGGASARFSGVALEPEPLTRTLPELRARRIQHGQPAPFRSPGTLGFPTTRWTTVALPSVSHETVSVFLCAYAHDVANSRRESLEQLRLRSGGPLSVLSVREMVYGATDTMQMHRQWQSLLAPIAALSPGVWSLGDGPALRVRQASGNSIRGLVINVASLGQAREFLSAHGLLGADHPGELTLGGPSFEGVHIVLVQGDGA